MAEEFQPTANGKSIKAYSLTNLGRITDASDDGRGQPDQQRRVNNIGDNSASDPNVLTFTDISNKKEDSSDHQNNDREIITIDYDHGHLPASPDPLMRKGDQRISLTTQLKSITLTWTDIEVKVENIGNRRRHGGGGFSNWWCLTPNRGQESSRRTGGYGKIEDKKVRVLKNVSGVALPGRLLAIMGASGAGKTTLLNVLTSRNLANLQIAGRVRVNGEMIGSKIRKFAAYVQQDYLFIGVLKVREHLMFHARLRLGKNVTERERVQRVEEVLAELSLSKCQNTIIGGLRSRRKGISGGERKRLAFATEVLTNPGMLFCDEPTSGLDSFTALQTVQVLKSMAALEGKTVICTIHQPSSQVFEQFDDLCLLTNGRIAYLGPANNAKDFFDKQGFTCPPNFNPADYYVRILAITPGKEKECRERTKKISRAYEQSHERENLRYLTNEMIGRAEKTDRRLKHALAATGKYKSTWCQQYKALLWRAWIENVREPMLIPVRFMQTIIIAVLLGLVYYDTKLVGNTGIQNLTGLIFLFVANMTFQFVFAVTTVFSEELPIFLKEHFSGVYRVDTYYLAKVVSELPQYTFFPFLFTVILYFMAGLESSASVFFTLAGINILTCNVAISVGYTISCLFQNSDVALSVAPAIVIPSMLFAGYYVNLASIPSFFNWLQYLSYFKYSYEAAVINQFSHVTNIPGCGGNATCAADGTDVLQSMSIGTDTFYLDIIILAAMIVALRFLSYLALLVRTYVRKD